MKQGSRKVSFTLAEPAKTEYRSLKAFKKASDRSMRNFANELEVYTVGNEDVSPLRFNPLEILPGIGRDEHIENLLGCLMAAMPVSGPLPALIGESLEKVYEDYPDPDRPPVMADLVVAANAVLAAKGYSAETNSDIRTAMEVRIEVLNRRTIGTVFQCRHSVPSIEHLMSAPSIIELDRLPPDQACLLLLFEFNGFREYLRTSPASTSELNHAILVEEAHNIVGRVGDARPSEDIADPKAFATEFICRMLAELRALGVAMVIIDQLPSAVAPEVIKNTGSKLAFRQVANQDREELGGTMLFGDVEMQDIARLQPGEAFLYTEGYFGPRKIKTVNLHEHLELSRQLTDSDLLRYIQEDEWFREMAKQRTSIELKQLKEHMDTFDAEKANAIKVIQKTLSKRNSILDGVQDQHSNRALEALAGQARRVRQKFISSYKAFVKGPYRRYLPKENIAKLNDVDIAALADCLANRFKSVIEPDTKTLIAFMDCLIAEFMNGECREFNNAKKE